VLLAGRDDDHLAGTRDDALASHFEAHRALHDLEALLLLGMNVLTARDTPAGGKLELDREQLTGRVGRRFAEGDALSARRVLECLSSVRHSCSDLVADARRPVSSAVGVLSVTRTP